MRIEHRHGQCQRRGRHRCRRFRRIVRHSCQEPPKRQKLRRRSEQRNRRQNEQRRLQNELQRLRSQQRKDHQSGQRSNSHWEDRRRSKKRYRRLQRLQRPRREQQIELHRKKLTRQEQQIERRQLHQCRRQGQQRERCHRDQFRTQRLPSVARLRRRQGFSRTGDYRPRADHPVLGLPTPAPGLRAAIRVLGPSSENMGLSAVGAPRVVGGRARLRPTESASGPRPARRDRTGGSGR